MSLNMRLRRNPLRPVLAILSLAALLAVLAVGIFGSSTSANVLGSIAAPPLPGAQGKTAASSDGFDALPASQKALSYSTLVNKALVHPPASLGNGGPVVQVPAPKAPALNIVWGVASNISGSPGGGFGANEPAAAMHPSNPLLAAAGSLAPKPPPGPPAKLRAEEHTSELQSRFDLVCRLLPGTT